LAWPGASAAAPLRALAHNRDPRSVRPRARSKSVGSQQALGPGLTDMGELDRVVLTLADRVGRRLRSKNREGRTINLRARLQGRVVSRSETLDAATSTTEAIHRVAQRLLRQAVDDPNEPVTLVGISVSQLSDDAAHQLELHLDEGEAERTGSAAADAASAIDRQIDEIRRRYGNDAVTRAGLLGREDRNAPDDFRRLA